MAYRISIGDTEDYVTVKHVGEVTYRELEAARDKIKDILFEKKLIKIFVDLREMTPVLEKVEKSVLLAVIVMYIRKTSE